MSDDMVSFGSVCTFSPMPGGHETTRKLVEEAAEVLSAWEDYEDAGDWETRELAEIHLIDELADVVQCVANVAACIGVHDMRDAMEGCESRNRARGRMP